jgi:predicted ArsR family transcriptional regulator
MRYNTGVKTTRQLITDFLRTKRTASVREMSRALRVTAADIRHHLSILTEEGVVVVAGQEPVRGKGRPTQLYGLAGELTRNNYDNLADALLDTLLYGKTSREADEAINRTAEVLAGPKPAVRNPGQSLMRTVDRMNALHYQARWEARPDAPRVILGHCPYAALLQDHPELCRMDERLLENLLGVPVTQTSCREPTSQGLHQCVFVVGKK